LSADCSDALYPVTTISSADVASAGGAAGAAAAIAPLATHNASVDAAVNKAARERRCRLVIQISPISGGLSRLFFAERVPRHSGV